MKKSVFLILLGVLCFVVFYGIRYIENPVETKIVTSEVYENKIDTAGYIVKNEQVYTANASGRVYHYIQEGTRVGKYRVLSTVYAGDVSEETLQELNNIGKKIAELENEGEDTSYMAGGINGEEDIENIKNNIIRAKMGGSVEKIAAYKAQINAIVTGEVSAQAGSNLDQLYARKSQLEASLKALKNDIYSQISGVFSKNVDSLEGVLTPDNVMTYKLADFNALKSREKEEQSTAGVGQPVCKVVNNHTWYVMMTVGSETAGNLKVGKSVDMRFSKLPGLTAKGKIEYISTEESGTEQNVVIVKCEEYKEGVFSMRYSEIELILESYEGFRVPVSALRVTEDGKRGVLVKSGGAQIFKPCNVIYTDTLGGTVIISPASSGAADMLREYDCIVVGEK